MFALTVVALSTPSLAAPSSPYAPAPFGPPACGGQPLYCYNGGLCAYNQCICPPGFRGTFCEYGELFFLAF